MKSPDSSLEFVLYLIQSNQYVSSSFIHILLQWMSSPNLCFIEMMVEKIKPIIKDEDAIDILDYKIKERGIVVKKQDAKIISLVRTPQFLIFKKELINNYKRHNQKAYA